MTSDSEIPQTEQYNQAHDFKTYARQEMHLCNSRCHEGEIRRLNEK